VLLTIFALGRLAKKEKCRKKKRARTLVQPVAQGHNGFIQPVPYSSNQTFPSLHLPQLTRFAVIDSKKQNDSFSDVPKMKHGNAVRYGPV
jgi:hypothetical protein